MLHTNKLNTEKTEQFKENILKAIENNLLQDVDGLYYFSLTGSGMYTSSGLRIIADELDKRNKDWNEYINKNL